MHCGRRGRPAGGRRRGDAGDRADEGRERGEGYGKCRGWRDSDAWRECDKRFETGVNKGGGFASTLYAGINPRSSSTSLEARWTGRQAAGGCALLDSPITADH